MDESQFNAYLLAADSLGSKYSGGYRRGLRRYYHQLCHGDTFDEAAQLEHEYLLAVGTVPEQADLHQGYLDGVNGRPPRGHHFNLGNAHAQRGDAPADTKIQARASHQDKALFQAQAEREGLSLSAWMLKTLKAACTREREQQ